jgi:hypothetical protein
MFNTKFLYYHQILPDIVFNRIIENLKKLNLEDKLDEGCVLRSAEFLQEESRKERRDCKISWIEYNESNLFSTEIFNILWNSCTYLNMLNNWNFDIIFLEDIQYTYYEIGSRYDWHTDVILSQEGSCRKISIILLLENDCEGGEFQIETKIPFPDNENGCRYETIPLQKGSLLVFHSDIPHRVTPLKSGSRKTLVAWANGPNFK